jgi:hypothetical protein
MLILNPDMLPSEPVHVAEAALVARDILPVDAELRTPEHNRIDDLLSDVLNLTMGERDAVYEAVVNLVEARLKKRECLISNA